MPVGRLRSDPLRATASLYGPERANRPRDAEGAAALCPFCPGNEHLTAPLLTADPGPAWTSRVVANRYPAVVAPQGRHEVIIEGRAHDARWPDAGEGELQGVLELYAQREAAGFADGYAFVSVFKNSGAAAGASLRHPHSQVIALRDIPPSIAERVRRLGPDCPVCAEAAAPGERTVLRSMHAVAYVPCAARTAFEVRIAPVGHAPRLSAGGAALAPVAALAASIMRRLRAVLGADVPFNAIVQSAPRDARAEAHQHWELEIVPRVENLGGFELGTGSFLVSRLPEEAAGILRGAPNGAPHA
jgi:UDPglucose--hexose-1-phosphate uridylyltransferase